MKRQGLVWRKSVYDNNFICKCGEKLGPQPLNLIPDHMGVFLHCPTCGMAVCYTVEVEVPENIKPGALLGNLDDWQNGH